MKVTIEGKEFFVIKECVCDGHTLCVATEPWGRSSWGIAGNGQDILDVADNSISDSLTNKWFKGLPKKIKSAMKTVRITTHDENSDGTGLSVNTEMFVPSLLEWKNIPGNIRKKICANEVIWTRSFSGNDDGHYYAWYVESGNIYCGGVFSTFQVVPAFYLDDAMIEELQANQEFTNVKTADVKNFLIELDKKIQTIRSTTYSNDIIQNEGIKTILVDEVFDIKNMVERLFTKDCFSPEKDTPYPLCVGKNKPECEECQLRADWEPEDPYGVDS